jgi:steroid delta-isomerase-like uncharacterized protein
MEDAKCISEACIRAWIRHDVDAILAIVSEDFIYDERPMTMHEPLVGKPAFTKYLTGVFTAFPDLSIEILSLEVGETVAWSESIMRGTQTGRVNWMPPSKKQMIVRVACAFEVAHEQLIHERLYWDRANALRQFGSLASVFGIFSQPIWKPAS